MSIWDGDVAQPEAEREADWNTDSPDAWRGTVHLEDWPRHLAGPEYWLYLAEAHLGDEE